MIYGAMDEFCLKTVGEIDNDNEHGLRVSHPRKTRGRIVRYMILKKPIVTLGDAATFLI